MQTINLPTYPRAHGDFVMLIPQHVTHVERIEEKITRIYLTCGTFVDVEDHWERVAQEIQDSLARS